MPTHNEFLNNTNQRFHAYFLWLCLFALINGIVNLLFEIKELRYFGDFSNNPWLDATFFAIYSSLNEIALWIAIGFTFNTLRAAIVSVAITLILFALTAIDFHANFFTIPVTVNILLGCIPFFIFGILFFKNSKAIYLLLISPAIWGITIATDSTPLLRLIDAHTDISLFMKIRNADARTYHYFDPVRVILSAFIMPLIYLIVFYFLCTLQKGTKNFLTFTDCTAITLKSPRDYSLIYWLYRMLFFVGALGIFSFIANQYESAYHTQNEPSLTYIGMSLFCYVLSVYICVSIYRNFIASYFIYHNKPISWNYFLLNIPVINIIAWLISVKNSEPSDPTHQNNTGIKILLSVAMVLSFVVVLIQHPIPKTMVIIEFMIGFALLLLFMQLKAGIYFILAALAFIVFIVAFNFSINEYDPPSLQMIFTLLIIYPIFHLQEFSFNAESTLKKIYKAPAAINYAPIDNSNKYFTPCFLWLCFLALIIGIINPIAKSSMLGWTTNLLNDIALWIAVGLTFNAFRSAIITIIAVIILSVLQIGNFYTGSLDIPRDVIPFIFFIPFLIFGIIHLKNIYAIYLLMMPAILMGIGTIIFPWLVDSIESISLLESISSMAYSFLTPLCYLLTFYFVSTLQKSVNNFTDWNTIRLHSRKNHPLIYWLYPITFFIIFIGMASFIFYLYKVFR